MPPPSCIRACRASRGPPGASTSLGMETESKVGLRRSGSARGSIDLDPYLLHGRARSCLAAVTLSVMFRGEIEMQMLSNRRTALLVLVASLAIGTSVGADAATVNLRNNCTYTVYPGIFPASLFSNGGWS